MAKKRIYQLAREYNLTSKQLLSLLADNGFNFSSHFQSIEENIVKDIINTLKTKTESKKDVKELKPEAKKELKDKEKLLHKNKVEKIKKTNIKQVKKDTIKSDKILDKKKKNKEKKEDVDINLIKKKYNKMAAKKGKKKKYKNKNKAAKLQELKVKEEDKDELLEKYIQIPHNITVGELSEKMNMPLNKLILSLMSMGYMLSANDTVTDEVIKKIEDTTDYVFDFIEKSDTLERLEVPSEDEDLPERPPIITIMGHVDHGKTSLLDVIRHSNITKTEAGGITQKIGAYQVEYEGKKLTFIDTPGHEAFTSMRARGAQVTDIAILVVAADDGVMPQTIEAINHAKAAKVPIIVAVNKIDKPNANVDRVKQQLTEYGLIPEEWGGDTVFVDISAKKKIGIDALLEYILLVAEMQELKADTEKKAKGIIIESRIDRGKGAVATVLVKEGTLKVGDPVVVGSVYGRIRAMIDDKGKRIKEALPSTPVEILGLSSFSEAGAILEVVESEKVAKSIALKRSQEKEIQRRNRKMTLSDISKDIKEGTVSILKLIVKADSDGSLQAIAHSLNNIVTENKNITLKIIHSAIGAISESDVMLASASNAVVLGFNVKMSQSIKKLAEKEKVEIRLYNVIYDLIEDVTEAISGMQKEEEVEVEIGRAEVRAVFNISKEGRVAGCYVKEGKVMRNCIVEVVRNNNVLVKSKVSSLKRFKDDVSEVVAGYECGIAVKNFARIEVGDILVFYTMQKKGKEK